MEIVLLLFCAILPAFALLAFIYWKDRKQPEPISQILKGVLFGVISAILAAIVENIIELLTPDFILQFPIVGSIYNSFVIAAFTEEALKLLMLWLLLRNNKYFDESLDAIVYAVCIGMGFAGLENIGYLFNSYYSEEMPWLVTSVQRAILAVPGHYAFAVMMGFFYALVHFMPRRFGKYRVLVFIVPFVLHGLYDSLCFLSGEFNDVIEITLLITFGLFYFCYRMHRFCISRIKSITKIDEDFEKARMFEKAMKK